MAILATSASSLGLALTGEIAAVAETLELLLLIVFAAVNADLLILRRESGEAEYFRVPLAVPWCGLVSRLQRNAET
ncbi:hypothetical protein ABZ413_06980 [Nocardia rhamnosiphila]|uniref:hypothetical protein n=1 Tax=Nocardia rhamnosiphila TaxID=426716 RepID=UPI00340803F1